MKIQLLKHVSSIFRWCLPLIYRGNMYSSTLINIFVYKLLSILLNHYLSLPLLQPCCSYTFQFSSVHLKIKERERKKIAPDIPYYGIIYKTFCLQTKIFIYRGGIYFYKSVHLFKVHNF